MRSNYLFVLPEIIKQLSGLVQNGHMSWEDEGKIIEAYAASKGDLTTLLKDVRDKVGDEIFETVQGKLELAAEGVVFPNQESA